MEADEHAATRRNRGIEDGRHVQRTCPYPLAVGQGIVPRDSGQELLGP
jgi:hypothetical protein